MEETLMVLVVGCKGVERAFLKKGLFTRQAPSIKKLLMQPVRKDVRAVVVREALFKDQAIEPLIRSVRKIYPICDVIVWAANSSPPFIREAFVAGANEVVLENSPDALAQATFEIIQKQQKRIQNWSKGKFGSAFKFEGLFSRSSKMWDIFELCLTVAHTDAAVLIYGETGTGKELLARAIHRRSGRKGPFVAVNCGAIPDTLIDSELFGHVKGAFTGAVGDKKGLFRHAEGGTLFLDEISTIPFMAQARLLRALQEYTIRAVGGHQEEEVDVRVIAATGTPLEKLIEEGRFREDLFYRLDVLRFILPTLRDRPEDIIFLFGHFTRKFAKHHGTTFPGAQDDFLNALVEYDWPGNVRQLENFAERIVLSAFSKAAAKKDFKRMMRSYEKNFVHQKSTVGEPQDRIQVNSDLTLSQSLLPVMETLERQYLESCLEMHKGRVGKTAQHAGITRRTLLRKLNKHGLEKKDFTRK